MRHPQSGSPFTNDEPRLVRRMVVRHRGGMTATTGVLSMLGAPNLSDEADRICAAVGLRIIHAAATATVSRKAWSAAAAVLLDEDAAARCGDAALPRRARVFVVAAVKPTGTMWRAALAVGAQRVLTLPVDEDKLVAELAEAGEAVRSGDSGASCGDVVAVVGGRGGAGASIFAAALAQAAGEALLIDLDPWGGGLDLLIGSENVPGLRWPDLAPQGGRLAWSAIRSALPRQRNTSVLSGGRCGYEPDAATVDAIIGAGRRGGVTVICDLPRWVHEAAEIAVNAADLVVLVSPCDVRGCAAATVLAPRLQAVNPNAGLVVRGPSPGGLRATDVAAAVGLPLLAVMRAEPGLVERLEHRGLRLPSKSSLTAAARQVLDLLPSPSFAPVVNAAVS